ncbi:uncharacterized protein PWA37_005238 [Arxiozyma heterogenica]|uniref:Cell wall mannoprotein PIR1-like C-terminal domain-containing protein n=1 Tax=Arxiozyma heterogenica TaxID=278026 RepID=A0AAN7WJQ7_9SACH|nr:hypothetical protein RI543_000173 [Kazachstania heterogenica]
MQFKKFSLTVLATLTVANSAAVTTTKSTSSVSGYVAGEPYSTLTPSGTWSCGITNFTSTFGIAVQAITDSAILSSVSAKPVQTGQPTTTSSASTTTLSPSSSTSSICTATSTFAPSAVSCSNDGTLQLTLHKGILTDEKGRIGSIVSNRQFQFDGPTPQAGAIYAAGWSITEDGYLALGDSDIFYQCLSGNFYNLYDEKIAEQCSPIHLEIVSLVKC